MKNILLIISLVAVYGFAYSQEDEFMPPDYDQIKQHIKDENSLYYYPRLLSMVESSDTSLDIEAYRHLYYGQVFRDDYSPYGEDSDETLMPYYQLENITDKEQDEFIDLATKALKKNPVDLRPINFMAYIYHLKGNEEMAMKLSDRFFMTLSAILSTGDGESCETGYHVIYISHEYVFMNVFDFNLKMQSLINDKKHSCDYMEFEENPKGIEGVYFNIDKPFGTLIK
ncbi:MAG TPA: DUF4919 domain-containing protein [Lentimicrobium sp.]|nr:DUF4919 domain-containing protein [Lentimicrobium sp.]